VNLGFFFALLLDIEYRLAVMEGKSPRGKSSKGKEKVLLPSRISFSVEDSTGIPLPDWNESNRPSFELATQYRTRAIEVNEYLEEKEVQRKSLDKPTAVPPSHPDGGIEYHVLPIEKVLEKFATTSEKGLGKNEATRRLQENGPNVISPPQKNLILEILSYIFSGFGLLLWPASILCILAWKPFGDPPGRSAVLVLD
jgi:hypothetical protein